MSRPLLLVCATGAVALCVGHGCSTPRIAAAPEDDARSQVLYEEATQLHETGQHQAALDKFELITKDNPSFWKGWYGKAVALMKLDQNEAAFESINKAIRLHEEDANVWQVLGMIYWNLGRFEQAHKAIDRSNEIGHGLIAETWFAKGAVFCSTKHYPEAIDCFNRAIVINSSHVNACTTRVSHGISCRTMSKPYSVSRKPQG